MDARIRFLLPVWVGIALFAGGQASGETYLNTYFVNNVDGIDGDATVYGTISQPFQSIPYALSIAASMAENHPATLGWSVIVNNVTVPYEAPISGITVAPGVNLIGWNTPVIELPGYGACITMGPSSNVLGFDIQAAGSISVKGSAGAFDTACVRMYGASGKITSLWQCSITGTAARDTTAVEVYGGEWMKTSIADCKIINHAYGVAAYGSGVNITRCRFESTTVAAVYVDYAADKQSGETVPMLGDSENIEKTGLNQFDDTEGLYVQNVTDEEVSAESNDWGTADATEIDDKTAGDVDTTDYFTKSIGPGTVVVSLLDSAGDPVSDGVNPTCTLSGVAGVRDATSLTFIFDAVSSGQHDVEAAADGYTSESEQVTVSSITVTAVELTLSKPGTGGCGGSGKAAYACCALVIWTTGKRYKKNHPRPRKQ